MKKGVNYSERSINPKMKKEGSLIRKLKRVRYSEGALIREYRTSGALQVNNG